MKAQEESFLDILGRPDTQFIVPIFQRVYSWKPKECEELFEDILKAGSTGGSHFIGTFLYSPCAHFDDAIKTFQIIDGQQRATTFTLMLLAYTQWLRGTDERGRQKADMIVNTYLTCKDSADGANAVEPKLLLTSIDSDMLSYLLGLEDKPADISARLQENLDTFKKLIGGSGFDGDAFWRGCELLHVISIELEGNDSPQEVFESLNSKGKRLAVEDLIRNSILSGDMADEDMRMLYEDRWLPLEEMVEKAPGVEMEDILCSWIASNHKDVYLDSKSEVYPLFKSDVKHRFKGDYRKMIANLKPYATMFVNDEQWRRDRLYELDRWLQGKPRNLISERKIFGD